MLSVALLWEGTFWTWTRTQTWNSTFKCDKTCPNEDPVLEAGGDMGSKLTIPYGSNNHCRIWPGLGGVAVQLAEVRIGEKQQSTEQTKQSNTATPKQNTKYKGNNFVLMWKEWLSYLVDYFSSMTGAASTAQACIFGLAYTPKGRQPLVGVQVWMSACVPQHRAP